MTITLYDYTLSGSCYKVRLLLNFLGLTYDRRQMNFYPGLQHKSPEFRAKNSMGQLPALELDDGTCISETVAICRYLEETHPEPPLFGRTPVEKALVDQWVRRVEFAVMMPVGNFWRHAHPRTAALLTQFKDFGQSNTET